MVTAIQNPVSTSPKQQLPRPHGATEASAVRASANTDQPRRIAQASKAGNKAETKLNIFVRFWNWIKSWFSPKKKEAPIPKRVAGAKIELSKSQVDSKPFEKVKLHRGLITIDDMEELTKKYIVVFSDNAIRIPGLFGQTSVLGPARRLYPESVVGIPVSARPVTSYDFQEVKNSAMTENSAEEVQANLKLIEDSIDEAINKAKQQNKTILVLQGGYGTGFSRMPMFSPLTFKGMVELFKQKLGVSYQLDSVNGRYSLALSDQKAPVNNEELTNQEINLWEDPWVVMNHGQSSSTAQK